MSPPLIARSDVARTDVAATSALRSALLGPLATTPAAAAPAAADPPTLPAAVSAAAPARPVDDADLRQLLARAHAEDDQRLRALIHGYLQQRQALREVLAFLAAREGGAAIATVPALVRARALVAPAGAPPADGGIA